MKLPITLAIFTSCRGHFDKDTYEYTINDLFSKIDPNVFSEKVVHIKWRPEEGEKIKNMTLFFQLNGFTVLETMGEWKHNDNSHYVQHSKDIVTLMQSKEVHSQPFVFWMEDDVIYKTDDLVTRILEAIDFLNNYRQCMTVRILDLEDIIPSMKPFPVSIHTTITPHEDCFSFRSNIMRSRDAWSLGSFFKTEFPKLQGVHIERYATEVLRVLSGNLTPFSFFKLDKLRHIHIGSKEFDQNAKY